jgi:origin recognition complex subunit 4
MKLKRSQDEEPVIHKIVKRARNVQEIPYNIDALNAVEDGLPDDFDFEQQMEQEEISEQSDRYLDRRMASLDDVDTARRQVQSRLSGVGTPFVDLVRLDDQYSKLNCTLERSIKEGKGGSMMLLGPRGSGKTTLVNRVLHELREAHQKFGSKPFVEIRLNGYLQTDDKIALREIVRQLNLENEVMGVKLGSFAECLDFIVFALKSSSWSGSPLFFILEEIDLFALHPKQVLLYNLLDMSQSSKTPIFVIGLTSKLVF